MVEYVFKTCPKCAGYGVPDKGGVCKPCEGSGELIMERGKRGTIKKNKFAKLMNARESQQTD